LRPFLFENAADLKNFSWTPNRSSRIRRKSLTGVFELLRPG